MEEPSGIVIDDVKPSLASADIEIQVWRNREGRPPDFWPCSARYKVEYAIIVARLGEIAHEALGLAQVHWMVVAFVGSCRRGAYGAS